MWKPEISIFNVIANVRLCSFLEHAVLIIISHDRGQETFLVAIYTIAASTQTTKIAFSHFLVDDNTDIFEESLIVGNHLLIQMHKCRKYANNEVILQSYLVPTVSCASTALSPRGTHKSVIIIPKRSKEYELKPRTEKSSQQESYRKTIFESCWEEI